MERRNKVLYKLEILALKILPMLISLLYCIGTVLDLLGIDVTFITYMSGMSITPLLFMYLSSYVFKFCEYHRMFIHYTLIVWIINIYDYYIGIPINDLNYLCLQMIITGISLFIILYLYLKHK